MLGCLQQCWQRPPAGSPWPCDWWHAPDRPPAEGKASCHSLQVLLDAVEEAGGRFLLTADHGNAEDMVQVGRERKKEYSRRHGLREFVGRADRGQTQPATSRWAVPGEGSVPLQLPVFPSVILTLSAALSRQCLTATKHQWPISCLPCFINWLAPSSQGWTALCPPAARLHCAARQERCPQDGPRGEAPGAHQPHPQPRALRHRRPRPSARRALQAGAGRSCLPACHAQHRPGGTGGCTCHSQRKPTSCLEAVRAS